MEDRAGPVGSACGLTDARRESGPVKAEFLPSLSVTMDARTVSLMKRTSEQRTADSFDFDLFRLSKSKAAVDVSPNTIRGYARQGLKLRRLGRAVFVSRTELDRFILQRAEPFVPSIKPTVVAA